MQATTTEKPKRFERPVIIRTGQGDRKIVDVSAAADSLLKAFPRETERHKAAMIACLDVIRGESHSLLARRAFVSAALEVGILAAD